MNRTLVISSQMWEDLRAHLLADSEEHLAFILAGHRSSSEAQALLARELVLVPDEDLIAATIRPSLDTASNSCVPPVLSSSTWESKEAPYSSASFLRTCGSTVFLRRVVSAIESPGQDSTTMMPATTTHSALLEGLRASLGDAGRQPAKRGRAISLRRLGLRSLELRLAAALHHQG